MPGEPPLRSVDAERSLLARAQAALARGRLAHAGEALREHRERFGPESVLREEREALFVQLLRAQGRLDEAEERAGEFRRRYPDSIFGRAMEQAAAAGPDPQVD